MPDITCFRRVRLTKPSTPRKNIYYKHTTFFVACNVSNLGLPGRAEALVEAAPCRRCRPSSKRVLFPPRRGAAHPRPRSCCAASSPRLAPRVCVCWPAGDGAGLSTWSLEEGIDIGAAPGGLAGDFTSPLVKSLQSRLERAEEQCAPLPHALQRPRVRVCACALRQPAAR